MKTLRCWRVPRSPNARPSVGTIDFCYDDGGRKAAGFKGTTGDCVCRAIAIATELPYKEVYDRINELAKSERPRKRGKRSSARDGTAKYVFKRIMTELGWTWTPTMLVGQGCRVHLRADELPGGRLIVRVSKHMCAVIEGIVHDTHCDDRDGTRCVYGYWSKDEAIWA